jgi:hypothetical protein
VKSDSGDKVKLEPLYSPEMAKIVPLIPNNSDILRGIQL